MSNQIESIQVLGSGCPNCHKLFVTTQEAVKQLGLEVEVEYITDIQEILKLGIISMPVLAINGQAIMAGQLPSVEQLKEIFQEGLTADEEECGCGHHHH